MPKTPENTTSKFGKLFEMKNINKVVKLLAIGLAITLVSCTQTPDTSLTKTEETTLISEIMDFENGGSGAILDSIRETLNIDPNKTNLKVKAIGIGSQSFSPNSNIDLQTENGKYRPIGERPIDSDTANLSDTYRIRYYNAAYTFRDINNTTSNTIKSDARYVFLVTGLNDLQKGKLLESKYFEPNGLYVISDGSLWFKDVENPIIITSSKSRLGELRKRVLTKHQAKDLKKSN